ncbi:MAG: hypothetical protein JNK82_12475 [Myxococcaceae bacterium]|nr:hypothetical protein [Myxococcaceae bacterium]
MRLRLGKSAAPPVVTLLVTLGVAASLGAVLYGVSSSLPFLASSAASDVNFAALNGCAQRAVGTRTGFALAHDGRSLAVFSGSQTVRCSVQADGGASPEVQPGGDGVTAAAFDFDGGLWLSRDGVWLGDAGFDDVRAVALAGTRHGVIAIEASGRVLALEAGGGVQAVAQLPKSVEGAPQLVVSADGERAALPVAGGVFVWDTATLNSVRAEAPCTVEAVWWLPRGHRLLLQCAPDFALEWDIESGEKTTAPPRKARTRSVLLPGLGVYVASCEQLPCTSSPP